MTSSNLVRVGGGLTSVAAGTLLALGHIFNLAVVRAIQQPSCCPLTHMLPAYWRGLLMGVGKMSPSPYLKAGYSLH